MSYFITILPLILVFYSLFITIISCKNIPSNFFNLASLGIKILSAHIMQESIFWFFYTTGYPDKNINVGEINYFLEKNPIFALFWDENPIFFGLQCPIFLYF